MCGHEFEAGRGITKFAAQVVQLFRREPIEERVVALAVAANMHGVQDNHLQIRRLNGEVEGPNNFPEIGERNSSFTIHGLEDGIVVSRRDVKRCTGGNDFVHLLVVEIQETGSVSRENGISTMKNEARFTLDRLNQCIIKDKFPSVVENI